MKKKIYIVHTAQFYENSGELITFAKAFPTLEKAAKFIVKDYTFMNPTEKMLLATFINPFVKDYDIASFTQDTEADTFWNGLTATEKEAVVAMYKAFRTLAR